MAYTLITRHGRRYYLVPEEELAPLLAIAVEVPPGWPQSVRDRRLEKGWTLAELARRSGYSLEHLSRVETGKLEPEPQTVREIERALRQAQDPAHPPKSKPRRR